MKSFRYLWLFVVVAVISFAFGETITLQQGVDGYDGCIDMHVFLDQNYSPIGSGKSLNTPYDESFIYAAEGTG